MSSIASVAQLNARSLRLRSPRPARRAETMRTRAGALLRPGGRRTPVSSQPRCRVRTATRRPPGLISSMPAPARARAIRSRTAAALPRSCATVAPDTMSRTPVIANETDGPRRGTAPFVRIADSPRCGPGSSTGATEPRERHAAAHELRARMDPRRRGGAGRIPMRAAPRHDRSRRSPAHRNGHLRGARRGDRRDAVPALPLSSTSDKKKKKTPAKKHARTTS